MLLPIIVVLFLRLLCECSRTYGASSRELGERHSSCDILLFLLLQFCGYSCGCCGCCECFYVLPPLLLLLQLLLPVVMDF